MSKSIDQASRKMDYVNKPLPWKDVPRDVRTELQRMALRYGDSGPRFMECTTMAGWFVLDRAAGEYFRKVAV